MPVTAKLMASRVSTSEIGKLVNAINGVTDRLTPTHPAEVADCVAIRDLVAGKLPAGYRIEVYHRIREVVVEVRFADGTLIFQQELAVKGAP